MLKIKALKTDITSLTAHKSIQYFIYKTSILQKDVEAFIAHKLLKANCPLINKALNLIARASFKITDITAD